MTLDQVVRRMPTRPGRRTLTFDEVVMSGRPAVFEEFGDHLLYLDDQVFILRDTDAETHPEVAPPVLERRALAHAVGFEIGWHHAEDCDCGLCAKTEQRAA